MHMNILCITHTFYFSYIFIILDIEQLLPNVSRRPFLFEVQILYREPTYDLWSGGDAREPFVAFYRGIQAPSHHEAVRIAQSRFRETARESQVRWQREVVEVRVRPEEV